jgi:hypothetical protein
MTAISNRAASGDLSQVNTTFISALRRLQSGLARRGSSEAEALQVTPAPPPLRAGDPNWIFDSRYTLTCAPAPSLEAELDFEERPLVVVRGSVDALDEVGEERHAAAAAQVGWEEARVTTVSGETTRTETFTVDATLGINIGDVFDFATIYADYSRNRVKTEEEGDGAPSIDNVEALELGLMGTGRLRNVRTTGRIAVTFDEVSEARYLRGNLRLIPITGGRGDLGLCGLNAFREIGFGIRGRCTLAAEAELREVLRRGTAELGTADTIAALGGSAGIEFARALDVNNDPQDGLVASARYTYLAVVNGGLRDIERLEANLAYRWWVDELGFDLGLSYADGTERKTFSDENRFGVRFGIIY